MVVPTSGALSENSKNVAIGFSVSVALSLLHTHLLSLTQTLLSIIHMKVV